MNPIASLVTCVFIVVLSGTAYAQWGSGWTIPAGAENENSPLEATTDVLSRGKDVFDSRCQSCHGPEGRGDGPDSDPRNPAADLTDEFRVDLNPDGVMYYRVWNGKAPVMPAFSGELTSDEVWAVVEYAKSLRNRR